MGTDERHEEGEQQEARSAAEKRRDGMINFPESVGDPADLQERDEALAAPTDRGDTRATTDEDGRQQPIRLFGLYTNEERASGRYRDLPELVSTTSAKLTEADLSGKDLRAVGRTDVLRRDFSGSSFQGSDLRGSQLGGAFSGTNFRDAVLVGSRIIGHFGDDDDTVTDFTRADLRYAEISGRGKVRLPRDPSRRKGLKLKGVDPVFE